MGKFEITLRRGCEVTRAFEEALLERSRAERERDGGDVREGEDDGRGVGGTSSSS
jgi:hypothetical protein